MDKADIHYYISGSVLTSGALVANRRKDRNSPCLSRNYFPEWGYQWPDNEVPSCVLSVNDSRECWMLWKLMGGH